MKNVKFYDNKKEMSEDAYFERNHKLTTLKNKIQIIKAIIAKDNNNELRICEANAVYQIKKTNEEVTTILKKMNLDEQEFGSGISVFRQND